LSNTTITRSVGSRGVGSSVAAPAQPANAIVSIIRSAAVRLRMPNTLAPRAPACGGDPATSHDIVHGIDEFSTAARLPSRWHNVVLQSDLRATGGCYWWRSPVGLGRVGRRAGERPSLCRYTDAPPLPDDGRLPQSQATTAAIRHRKSLAFNDLSLLGVQEVGGSSALAPTNSDVGRGQGLTSTSSRAYRRRHLVVLPGQML
jgi:hypothetical protein